MFAFSHEQFAQALCDVAQRRNIPVRLLVDGRTVTLADRPFFERMAAAGVEVKAVKLPPGAKLHLKCVVVDSRWVVTGTANWTKQAFGANAEDTLVIDSPSLAALYMEHMGNVRTNSELESIYYSEESGLKPSRESSLLDLPSTSGGVADFRAPAAKLIQGCRQVKVFFTPGSDGVESLMEQLKSATKSVDVGMYLLTHPDLVEVLASKSKEISVRLLADRAMIDPVNAEYLRKLFDAGCEIHLFGDGDRESMHMKTANIDGRWVWTGSANWTKGAFTQNIEDLLCFESLELADCYATYFESILKFSEEWKPSDVRGPEEIPAITTRRQGTMPEQDLPVTGPRTNYNSQLTESFPPFTVQAEVEYLKDEEYLSALLKMIDGAKQSFLGLVYVFSETKEAAPRQEKLIEALARAVKRGVYVYLILYTPDSPTDRLTEMHSNRAKQLRALGIDVRLAHPGRPMHAKLFVADQCRVLLGSHNWSEGSLSGERVRESSLLLTLAEPEARFAEYVLSRPVISDMRAKEEWDLEIARIVRLQSRRKEQREALIQEWLGEAP